MLTNHIYMAAGERELCLLHHLANRHGLIAGATGTGKTVTLQTRAEGFSPQGMPLCHPCQGRSNGRQPAGSTEGQHHRPYRGLGPRAKSYAHHSFPVCFWAVDEGAGAAESHPLRANDMGPLLLSLLLDLKEVQKEIMSLVFRITDDQGLLLLNLKDLRSMTTWVGENRKDYLRGIRPDFPGQCGSHPARPATPGRRGGQSLFRQPRAEIGGFAADRSFRPGAINILAADGLLQRSRLVLMWDEAPCCSGICPPSSWKRWNRWCALSAH